jgi:hypothetical protein
LHPQQAKEDKHDCQEWYNYKHLSKEVPVYIIMRQIRYILTLPAQAFEKNTSLC